MGWRDIVVEAVVEAVVERAVSIWAVVDVEADVEAVEDFFVGNDECSGGLLDNGACFVSTALIFELRLEGADKGELRVVTKAC